MKRDDFKQTPGGRFRLGVRDGWRSVNPFTLLRLSPRQAPVLQTSYELGYLLGEQRAAAHNLWLINSENNGTAPEEDVRRSP